MAPLKGLCMNPRQNRLLGGLPTQEFERFFPYLELVSLRSGHTLYEKGEVPKHVYFPIGGLVSVVCEVGPGETIETNMVGQSGILGISNFGVPSFYRAWVRESGAAYRMLITRYQQVISKCPVYVELFNQALLEALRYINVGSACGQKHLVDHQLMRWILVSLDRSQGTRFEITHGDIANLLGFRREVITLTLGKLAATGAITLGRGGLEVTQRRLLERDVCDCYWQISGKTRPLFTDLI